LADQCHRASEAVGEDGEGLPLRGSGEGFQTGAAEDEGVPAVAGEVVPVRSDAQGAEEAMNTTLIREMNFRSMMPSYPKKPIR
jgi:hypothetical protein